MEADREFILQPVPSRPDENILAMCSIELFVRPEMYTLADKKKIERLNLSISLRFRNFEFTLASNTDLRMIKMDRNVELYSFEEKELTLIRKAQQQLEIQEKESTKNRCYDL